MRALFFCLGCWVMLAATAVAKPATRPPASAPKAPPSQIQLVQVGSDIRLVFARTRIDGHPATLAFDTGTDFGLVLFEPAARRLKLIEPTAERPEVSTRPGHAEGVLTRPCRLEILEHTVPDARFAVVALPAALPDDPAFFGMIGWPAMAGNCWIFDLRNTAQPAVILERLPEQVPGGFDLVPLDYGDLQLRFPDGVAGPVLQIDTGNDGGVLLAPAAWERWRAAHPDAPAAIATSYMVGQGFTAGEIFWADEIALGPIVLRGVTVRCADPAYSAHAHGAADFAVLGLEALGRCQLVVSAPEHRALLLPSSKPAGPVEHNRIGVTFQPRSLEDLQIVAIVAACGPARDAGVLTGDELVSINGKAAATWWNDTRRPRRNVPAGTKVALVLRRAGKEFKKTLVARDLIGPKS